MAVDKHALIHALKQGDKEALPPFQRTYTPLVRYIISPILPDEADREECLSDVFLKVWQSIGSFDAEKGEYIRGYVTWWARMSHPDLSLNYNCEVRVTHQESRLNFPWRAPCQYQLETRNNNDNRFPSYQDLVLFQVKIDGD